MFTINATASTPITGPVKLRWTVNGSGPFNWDGQMTNVLPKGMGMRERWQLDRMARLGGNETYSPAQSNAVSILATAPPAEDDPILLIVVGVILSVVVIGGVAYLSSTRMKNDFLWG
jgi:hypothetical protein